MLTLASSVSVGGVRGWFWSSPFGATDMFTKVVREPAPFPPPYWWNFTIEVAWLLFTLAVTVSRQLSRFCSGVSCSRGNAAEVIRGRTLKSSRSGQRHQRVLVFVQIALRRSAHRPLLQIKSIRNQTTLDYGYDENSLYAARLALMEGTYPSEDRVRDFLQERRPHAAHNAQF